MKPATVRGRPSKLHPRKPRLRKEPILLVNPRVKLSAFQTWAVSALLEEA